jgi:putative addiction module killer protein
MIEVRQTDAFAEWLEALSDERAKARIAERIRRVSLGNVGDVEPVGDGVSELRIHYGPGYRVYMVRRGRVVVILLCGGVKSTQARDIRKAKTMAEEI